MTAKEDSIQSPLLDGHGQPAETNEQHLQPPDYLSSTIQDNETSTMDESLLAPTEEPIYDENGQIQFPANDLIKLEEQLNQTRWVVPVLPDGELIKCLRAAVRLATHKLDTKSEPCQRFIRDSLVNSFTKVLCDEAVQTWKHEIFKYIYQNCMLFLELCVLKIEDDCLPLLEILGLMMNPSCRYHQSNHSRVSDRQLSPDREVYGSSNEYRIPQRGWLIDFINRFGDLGGFDKILARFLSTEPKLTISVVVALLKPWGHCYEYLTQATVKKYFAPIINFVPQFLDQLTENDLKIETKSEPKSDTLSTVIKWLRYLASRIPDNEKECRNLDALRLKMILRLLQTNSFSGKMNALNEVNKLIMGLSSIQRATINRTDEPESLTAEKLTQWIQDNQVLDIVLRDCLHQPQYVEKLEKILRFIIKEHALSRSDLDKIWNSSCGKHEAIEKNVHDLLAKLAWDFSPEQLEHLFDCFRESWTKASKKQREKLLELIRRLAEDDKEGLMASKVLELLWNIAHDKHLPNEIIDQALTSHLKILDYSCLQEKEKTKLFWLDKFMDEVKHDRGYVINSLKQLREICMQFHEGVFAQNIPRMPGPQNRIGIIDILEKKYEVTRIVTENLCHYMDKTRKYKEDCQTTFVPEEYYPDDRFNHNQQIHERLHFLKFTLKEGRSCLSAEHSKTIWTCLAEHPVNPNDREQCFRWFAEIIDEDDFEPTAANDFFQNHLMKLEPHLLTDLGMNCFDRFFKSVNAQLNKLQQKRRTIRLMNDEDLIGIEYLWKLIVNSSDEVADRGIQLMREIYTNISPQLKTDVKRIHESFISECFERLRPVFDSVKFMSTQHDATTVYQYKLNALIRIMIVLREYLAECDHSYHKERTFLPMSRAFRGRSMTVIIRVNTGQNRTDDFEHGFHSNDTWGHIRRFIHNRYKSSYGIIELYRNNEIIYATDDNKTLGQTDDRDRMTVTARWVQHQSHGGSSGESSSSESEMNNNNNNSLTTSGHQSRSMDYIDINAETSLPSVILSQKHEYYQFLIDIADLACKEGNTRLRDTARQILDLIPLDAYATKMLNSCFIALTANNEQPTAEECYNRLNKFYFHVSPSQMLYHLKATLINFLPASIHQVCLQTNNNVEGLHVRFLNAGGLLCLLNIISNQQFTDQCDILTRKSIYFLVLYLLKRLLLILAIYQLRLTNTSQHSSPFAESLEQILSIMPTIPLPIMNVVGEQQHVSISVEQKIAAALIAHRIDYPISKTSLLQYHHIQELLRLIWCLASNSRKISFETNLKNDFHAIHETFKLENINPNEILEENEEDDEGQLACREGLELLCIALALVPSSVENLLKETFFEHFFIDLILYCPYPIIRHTSSEQIFLLTSRCSQGQCEHLIQFFLQKQFQLLNKSSENFKFYSLQSADFFLLLCRLLSYAYVHQITPPNLSQQLDDEIEYLKHVTLPIDDHLLRGHLNIAKELLQFQNSDRKRHYGIDQLLIQQMIEQYLFPASTLLYQFRTLRRKRLSKQSILTTDNPSHNHDEDHELDLLKEPPIAICQTPMSTLAAFDLLVVLGTNCIDNLRLIDKYITDLFYTVPDSSLNEWDFAPLIGPRPNRSFVGLKNGGATCYMNSVLQQLFMIRSLRSALLSVNISLNHADDETDDDDQRRDTFDSFSDTKLFLKDNQSLPSPSTTSRQSEPSNTLESSPKNLVNERNEYNLQILRHIQWIFGHLLESKLQYYIPRGFWKIFKFSGEPVNLRDQHDAVEFLNTVVDSVDEALKSLNLPQICSKVLGGTFADQKICKDCPHRYSREEDFTLLSVDIRHSQNLKESLEQYVIGELLDGPNAYFCEKCNKKVDTVKRTCFKKLPQILAIQLKRFDYDWERETPIKFNDYFEFPRELDMEPYTVQGLAKAEGMSVIEESSGDDLKPTHTSSHIGTRYKLVGIIVHSGQANGGHYYSFVQHKEEADASQWYKFDDTDVSECKMDDDEEIRSQCFGGDYPAQSFDQPVMKRQRRWWNAYILFYESISNEQSDSTKDLEQDLARLQLYDQSQRMPLSVQRSVRKQNIKFLHNRIHFSPEYFHFMKRLVQSNVQVIVNFFQPPPAAAGAPQTEKTPSTNTIEAVEELALVSVQIATKFLFSVGWRTKKALRGPAIDWTELIIHCIRWSRSARYYLAKDVLFKHPSRFQEYLIDCTSAEIRNAFGKMLVALASHSRQDEQVIDPSATDEMKNDFSVEESILNHVLRLLKKEMPDNVKMLAQYFQFFVNYSSMGRHECEQLIRLNVPTLFVNLANDDSTSSSCSTLPRYGEPAKLFVILSTLIRCFDVSAYCRSRQLETKVLPNPCYTHENDPICPMPASMAEMIYKRDIFLKKIIEDSGTCEESLRLLRFLLWENPDVTSVVLNEIMTLLSIYHTYDFRTHFEVLYMILTIDDSWQEVRLLYALKGLPMGNVTQVAAVSPSATTANSAYESPPQSLFDMFFKSKSTYQKKAYHCVKTLVQLFSNCAKAHQILKADADVKHRWSQAVHWLHEQLERSYSNVQTNYPYYPSQGPVTSNDMSQGYFIERTQSARSLLDKAVELCPEMVENDDAGSNSDDAEEDEPIESVSPSVGLKNAASHVTSKLSSRRPNSPTIVTSGSNQRVSPAPTTPVHNNQQPNKPQHHPRS